MPVVFDQPNIAAYNAGTINDGVTIAAPGVRLTNTDSGRIYGGVTFTTGGSALTNLLGGWIGISSNVITGPLIVGSTGADTVINGGIIAGSLALNDGDDIFVARSTSSGLVDLGSGDDIYRVETSQPYFINAAGGAGFDQIVFAGTANQYWADASSGFEQIVFENGGNFVGFSGFESIIIQPMSGNQGFVNFVDGANPAANVQLNGPSLSLNRSSVYSISSNEAANGVELGIGSTVYGGISLGGGDDSLTLYSGSNSGAPALTSAATGGTGIDTIMLNWFSTGDRSYDLSLATGFEKLNVNAWYGLDGQSIARVSHAAGLTSIDIGTNDTLVLSNSVLPDARVGGAFGGGLILEAGVVIDRYGFPEDGMWDDRLDLAQGDPARSVTLTNRGAIEGNVRFYIGDDVYDGRDGTVGGPVYGNAGNDRLLGGNAAEQLNGGYGADTLQGGGGADILTGGPGNDLFLDTAAGHDGDVITDFGRNDSLVFSGATLEGFRYSVTGNVLTYTGGSLTMQGIQGISLLAALAPGGGVQLSAAPPPIIIAGGSPVVLAAVGLSAETVGASHKFALADLALAASQKVGGAGDDSLTGTIDPDELYGLAGNDRIEGLGGADYINGGPGADVMIGGSGNDTYVVDDAGDQVIERPGEGLDAIYSSVDFVLPPEVENLTLTGTAGVAGFGNGLNNFIAGNAGANHIDGGAGADTMAGGAGDDVYEVDSAGDIVGEFAGEGEDAVRSSVSHQLDYFVETLILTGANPIDGTGNDEANRLFGNDNVNVLSGRGGADVLTGGLGDDLFLDTTAGHNGDIITDFVRGDRLIFTDSDLSSLNFAVNGDVLNYGTGSLTLHGLQNASLIASQAPEGGVQITFTSPPLIVSAGAAVHPDDLFAA